MLPALFQAIVHQMVEIKQSDFDKKKAPQRNNSHYLNSLLISSSANDCLMTLFHRKLFCGNYNFKECLLLVNLPAASS